MKKISLKNFKTSSLDEILVEKNFFEEKNIAFDPSCLFVDFSTFWNFF